MKIYYLASLLLLCSCNTESLRYYHLDKWSGEWVDISEHGTFVEEWKFISDTLMMGKGSLLVGSDTAFSEELRLVLRKKKVYYIPTISDQNNGKAILFELKRHSQNNWTFENREHDFPKTINYKKQGENTLVATLEGIEDSIPRKLNFQFKKSNQ